MLSKLFGNVLLVAVTLSLAGMAPSPNVVITKKPRPYKAKAEYLAVGFPCGVFEGSGKATHLGKITESGSYCAGEPVGPVGPGLFPLSGEATQVAANGDTLTYTFEEIVDFNTEPFTAIGIFNITGGTGRFAGATGGGTFFTEGVFLDEGLGLSIEYEGEITY